MNEKRYVRELKKTTADISAALSAAGLVNWEACESVGVLDENLQPMDDPPFCSVSSKFGLDRDQMRAICKAEHVKVGEVLGTLNNVAIHDRGELGGWEIRPILVRTLVPKPPTKAQAVMKEEFRERFFKQSERHLALRTLSKKERSAIKLGGRAAGIELERKRGPLTGKMVADVVLAFVTQFVAVRERLVDGPVPKTEQPQEPKGDSPNHPDASPSQPG